MSHKQRRYTSDVGDREWQRIRWMFPNRTGAGRPMRLDLREVLNGTLYVVRTGCQWRNVPSDLPKAQSVYYHFGKWCLDGTWQRINWMMGYRERRRVGRFARPSAGIVDIQSVKTTECGGVCDYDGHQKVKGRKRPILVDTLGNLLETVVLAANLADSDGARVLLNKVERISSFAY